MPSALCGTSEDFGNVMVINFTRDTFFFSYFIRLDDVERINGIWRKIIRKLGACLNVQGTITKKLWGSRGNRQHPPVHPTTRSNKGCPRQNDHESVAFVMYSLITRIICRKTIVNLQKFNSLNLQKIFFWFRVVMLQNLKPETILPIAFTLPE